MSHAPLTILQVTYQGDGAGSTQSIFNLSQHLARRGHRVLVGCRAESLLARLAAGSRDGLEVVPLDFRRLGALAASLADVVARRRVDVVNSHATRDRRALTWLRWRGRLPIGFVVTRRTMPLTSPVELVAVGATADRTIAVSAAVARALRRRLHPGRRLVVVPNGIDLGRVDARGTPGAPAAARAPPRDLGDPPPRGGVARRQDHDGLPRAAPLGRRPPP